MDKVFALSLKEFILWIRSEKKRKESTFDKMHPPPLPLQSSTLTGRRGLV